jgi:hypothetical protein
MKNRLPFVMLSLSWLTGFIAAFFFSSVEFKASDFSERTSILQEISSPDFHSITLNEKVEVPSLEIDWKLSWNLNSEWIPSFITPFTFYLAPSFFQKSRALFDVKALFMHFFHTW